MNMQPTFTVNIGVNYSHRRMEIFRAPSVENAITQITEQMIAHPTFGYAEILDNDFNVVQVFDKTAPPPRPNRYNGYAGKEEWNTFCAIFSLDSGT